ncbi:hypothetical protein AGDE_15675 [Angomonas deanei]|uniref:Uncharacterized protein n=1 Tax=Angomonas deanei TaxID=59799 RepID=A0A7G2CQW7_9TRYP|nr:hypothetical protein AGDE_15675 [Angomonas deanei]CAD2222216.1 hypothetical protein, conserved [Angomonas deanei]|eukprot:EPY18669.1 hypothetical protein AGDE_15675 [Angomonas deanei]
MEVAIPVLKEQTVDVDRKWWCQYLFFLGSQVEQDAATALSITKEAIYLFQQLVDTTADDENLKLLKNRLQFLLFSEFKLFSCQEPLLAEKDVLSLAQLLRELADGEDADVREVCFLSESEVFLRRYNMGEHDSDAATIFSIANVNKCMTDLNNLQLLADTLRCTATGLHCTKLGGLALEIQMSIIERTVESHGDCAVERNALHVMSLFSNVYEGLSTLEEKSKIVSLLKSYLYNNVRAASGEDTAGSLAAIQTFVEYFAVDAWNTAVKCNATRQRQLASYWKDVAVDFANLLFAENVTKETLYHFHEIMPLL